jgi:hypothetical protein
MAMSQVRTPDPKLLAAPPAARRHATGSQRASLADLILASVLFSMVVAIPFTPDMPEAATLVAHGNALGCALRRQGWCWAAIALAARYAKRMFVRN